MKAGDRYLLKLDDESRRFPDPASRFQPEGPHGPSEIIDPVGSPGAMPTGHGRARRSKAR